MSRQRRTIAVLLSLTLNAFAAASGAILKFHAAPGAEPVVGHYIVTLSDSVAEELAPSSAEALARAYVGKLEPIRSLHAREFAIAMLPSRARTLSADPRVREVVEVAQPDDDTEPTPTSAALARQHLIPATRDSSSSGTYVYDGGGNITAIGSDTFVYDLNGRLADAVVKNSEQSYTYDIYGNRLSATRAQGAVDCLGGTTCEAAVTMRETPSTTNHLANVTYDDAGNVVHGYDATYVYDGTGMVTQATVGSDIRNFAYTADDERIAVRRGASWTWTVRDQGGKVLREFTSTETSSSPLTLTGHAWSKDYVWRDGLLLASISIPSGASSPATDHYHLDHLGSPRLITRDGGVVVSSHSYYPFGAEMNLPSQENPAEAMKFTGHERDIVVGSDHSVDYMHARYYNDNLGRFLSVDPTWESSDLGQPQAWNRYSYVRNNPIGNSDPNGQICIPCAAVGALAAVSYESYRQVKSGEPVNNKRLLAAVGIGALAGATVGAAAETAPIIYTTALAHPTAVTTGTTIAAAALTPGPGGEIPNPEAFIPGPVNSNWGKLDYLLGEVPGSIKSQGLGGFFNGVLGFSKATEETLASRLLGVFADGFKSKVVNEKGLYEISGAIAGANGRTATIKTVWEALSDGTFKFVTAVPN